jgi:hypothetical protein
LAGISLKLSTTMLSSYNTAVVIGFHFNQISMTEFCNGRQVH